MNKIFTISMLAVSLFSVLQAKDKYYFNLGKTYISLQKQCMLKPSEQAERELEANREKLLELKTKSGAVMKEFLSGCLSALNAINIQEILKDATSPSSQALDFVFAYFGLKGALALILEQNNSALIKKIIENLAPQEEIIYRTYAAPEYDVEETSDLLTDDCW